MRGARHRRSRRNWQWHGRQHVDRRRWRRRWWSRRGEWARRQPGDRRARDARHRPRRGLHGGRDPLSGMGGRAVRARRRLVVEGDLLVGLRERQPARGMCTPGDKHCGAPISMPETCSPEGQWVPGMPLPVRLRGQGGMYRRLSAPVTKRCSPSQPAGPRDLQRSRPVDRRDALPEPVLQRLLRRLVHRPARSAAGWTSPRPAVRWAPGSPGLAASSSAPALATAGASASLEAAAVSGRATCNRRGPAAPTAAGPTTGPRARSCAATRGTCCQRQLCAERAPMQRRSGRDLQRDRRLAGESTV